MLRLRDSGPQVRRWQVAGAPVEGEMLQLRPAPCSMTEASGAVIPRERERWYFVIPRERQRPRNLFRLTRDSSLRSE
ncbi:MAG: hypothetical protein Fur005_06270 [Roseiflexaceae bacterium]